MTTKRVRRSPDLAERIWRAIRPKVLPYRIWPDPKPDILGAIRRVLAKEKTR